MELQRCLASLRQQTHLPNQIIVIEGGAARPSPAELVDGIEYHTSSPGITRQRNLARSLVRPDTDVVVYLDDDTVLATETLAQVQDFFVSHKVAVGVTGSIEGEAKAGLIKRTFGRLALLYTAKPFGLTNGLFNIINRASQPQTVDWLPGAFMCYRWPLVKDIKFDEQLTGYGLGEDLDFSLLAKTRGELWVAPVINVRHEHSPSGRDWRAFGVMRIVNRRYLRRKHFRRRPLFWLGIWWANGWLLLLNTIRAGYSKRYRAEWLGEIKALF